MDFFELNSFIVAGGIVCIGVLLAPLIQIAWTMRILISSYVGLSLVLLMPDSFVFNDYVNVAYFGGITVLFTFVAKGRFFSVSEWSVGRFSAQVFGLSILVWTFIISIICFLMPLGYIDAFMTKDVYSILTEYIFYFALTPLIFTILFSQYLR